MCRFSLLTVCLNPGEKLRTTLESALAQTYSRFEVIIKDGGSRDGSLEAVSDLLKDERIRVFTEKDTGIYDAMNQAVAHARGEYVFFLNCGDRLYDEKVLEHISEEIDRILASEKNREDSGKDAERHLIYGNVYSGKNNVWIIPAPKIDGFTCYRNVPCHQACFYETALCLEKPFEVNYRIRGDYEHFLWCFYRGNARMHYVNVPVAEYEGGGYSETKENLKRSKAEHAEITKKYMKSEELFRYKAVMLLTLAPLRTYLSESRHFAGIYSRIVKGFYQKRS